MNTLLITYQLDNYQESYPKISAQIKSYENWAKLFNRTWLVRSEKRTSVVRDELRHAILGNGKILVVNVSGSAWATSKVENEVTSWMHNNV